MSEALRLLEQAQKESEIATASENIALTLKQPSVANIHIRPHSFKVFWTTLLDRKARSKSKLGKHKHTHGADELSEPEM